MVLKKPVFLTAFCLLFLLAAMAAGPAFAAAEAAKEAPQAKPAKPQALEYAPVPVVKGYPAGESNPMFVLAVLPKDVVLAAEGDGKKPMTLNLAEKGRG